LVGDFDVFIRNGISERKRKVEGREKGKRKGQEKSGVLSRHLSSGPGADSDELIEEKKLEKNTAC